MPGALRHIEVQCCRGSIRLSDRENGGRETAVLSPAELPSADPYLTEWADAVRRAGYDIVLRSVPSSPRNPVFSSEAGRRLLENYFLVAGARIKYGGRSPLPENAWPLGFDNFNTTALISLLRARVASGSGGRRRGGCRWRAGRRGASCDGTVPPGRCVAECVPRRRPACQHASACSGGRWSRAAPGPSPHRASGRSSGRRLLGRQHSTRSARNAWLRQEMIR
jgi:hypothetical protein